MNICSRCDNIRWVCENHPDRPSLGECACTCGGAGMPCPACNRTDPAGPDDAPDMPKGFVPDVMSKALEFCLPTAANAVPDARLVPRAQV